jgi:hypothetical protein
MYKQSVFLFVVVCSHKTKYKFGAQTKHQATKRLEGKKSCEKMSGDLTSVRQMSVRQNVRRDKTSGGTKRPVGQNVLQDKTSGNQMPGRTKRLEGQNVRQKNVRRPNSVRQNVRQTKLPAGQNILYEDVISYTLLQELWYWTSGWKTACVKRRLASFNPVGQNVRQDKTSGNQMSGRTKRLEGQTVRQKNVRRPNVRQTKCPLDKTSCGTKHPVGQNIRQPNVRQDKTSGGTKLPARQTSFCKYFWTSTVN